MPTDRHLEWQDTTDFTPGLWEEESSTNALNMPENASQVMLNCVPLKQGGLRAFFKPATISTSGISSVSTEMVTGLYSRGGIILRSGALGDGTDRYILTKSTSDNDCRYYRMDGSNAETTWKQGSGYTRTDTVATCRETQFTYFKETGGDEYVVASRRCGTNVGIEKFIYVGGCSGGAPPVTDGVLTCALANYNGPLLVNQARLMWGGGNDERLYYSPVGDITPIDALSYVDIEPQKNTPNLVSLIGFAPDDILVAKEGAPWVTISGPISSSTTPIREMGDTFHGRFTEQEMVRTPGGVAFRVPAGDIFLTDGREFKNLTPMLQKYYKTNTTTNTDVVSVGKMAFLNGFLFAPAGYVYDFETGAWLTTGINTNYHHSDVPSGEVWASTDGTSFSFSKWFPYENASIYGTRMDTWTNTSAPFERQDGRQVEIREVQLYIKAFATSSVAVTVNGTTNTISSIAAGKHQLSFLFRERGEMLDVKIVAAATSSSNEAPVLERRRIGFGHGHQLPHGS